MRQTNWPLVLLIVYGGLVAIGAFLFVLLHATGVLTFRPEDAVAFWMLGLGVGIIPLGTWIVLHVWIYVDAERRGMNGALWAVLSFSLSLVGPILYLLLRQPLQGSCPACKAPVDASDASCGLCGQILKLLCGRCGGVLQSGWRVCPACGTPTTAPGPTLETGSLPTEN